jgi:FG-GAP-like repeat/PASTA domain
MEPPHAGPRPRSLGVRRTPRCIALLTCIGAALTLGVVARSAAGHAPSFEAAKNYRIGEAPNQVAVSDFNADRRPDLAIANWSSTVSVLLNKGDGTFEPARDYGTGEKPGSLAAADLNGDSRTDLVTANGHTISVFLNRGNGTFDTNRDYAAPGWESLTAVDLNGDNKADVAAADPDANRVSVLLNGGDGTFEPSRNYATGKYPASLAVANLNGDARPDLATANSEASTVSVLLNRGDGSFGPRRDFSAKFPQTIAIADLNRDRRRDIITGNPGSISVLLNRGGGSLRAHRDFATCRPCFPAYGDAPPSVVSIAIADLNHDGRPDVATRNIDQLPHEVFGGSISVFVNKGGGTFKSQHSYRTGPPDEEISGSLAVRDLNRSGGPDLATQVIVSAYAAARSHLLVLLGRGDGTFGPRLAYRIPNGAASTTVADLNADGKPDVVAPDSGGGRVWVLLNKPGLCNVQYVVGLPLATARATLARVNCHVGKVRRLPSKVKTGHVISQNPKFGAVRSAATKVDLVVSKGRRK